MSHNPVKSIKIDFHTADGMMPKPTPPERAAPSPVQSPDPQSFTKLSPANEAIFPSWARANGIADPDAPDNHYDYRGMYMQTGGKVHAPGQLQGAAEAFNGVAQNASPEPIQQLLGLLRNRGR